MGRLKARVIFCPPWQRTFYPVFRRQGHQKQRTDGKERGGPRRASHPPTPPTKRRIPACLSSEVGETEERVQLGTEK